MRRTPIVMVIALLAVGCQRAKRFERTDSGSGETAPQTKVAESPPPPAAPPPPSAPAAEQTYLVKSSGMVCVRAPCPYYLAFPAGKADAEPIQVHEIDFQKTGASAQGAEKWLGQLRKTGLTVQGSLEVRHQAGPAGDATVLSVARVGG